MLHDYGVAGHLLNNENELSISAFTSQPDANDIERGREALASIGYDETTSMRFLPAVQIYRNQTMFSVFLLLIFLFGAIYLSLFLYLRRQHKAFSNAEIPSANFWMAIPHPASNVHRLVTGTAFFMPSMKWRLSSLLMPGTSGRPKNFLQDIISDVSHQIKTPLSALKMYHEIIESHKDDAATVSSFTEKFSKRDQADGRCDLHLTETGTAGRRNYPDGKTPEIFPFSCRMFWNAFETWAEREHKTVIAFR